MLRALTFDYWDTLYEGGRLAGRVALRRTAVGALLGAYGRDLPEEQLRALYEASGQEAERWWSEEQRGYKTDDRLRWILEHAAATPREGCEHVAAAVDAVDNALLMLPPAMFPGAWQLLRTMQRRFKLAVISDTGFASGRAQDRLLEKDAARDFFSATIYSMDIGHAKPRPEIFQAAVDVLGVVPADILHIGDNERTDIRGALDAGYRAVRLDIARSSGPSEAEFVARSFEELSQYLATLHEH
ncbi:MAG: haloacid dehalogenase superfamily enzyme subfamily [Gemmatimonadetes bacterium]|nr:haloacid dehalogenase superfamily enzyme subfamily [Gemmatimonadota bacterium]